MADLKYGGYLDELIKRDWEEGRIRAGLERLRQNGFGPKDVDLKVLNRDREAVLARVRLRGEEYEYLTHSCSKGSALAVMEEFGLGNWDIVRSMSPFPVSA